MHGRTEYTLTFLAIGGGLVALAAVLGGVAWVLLWPGAAFLAVAAAYLGLGARLLGKRADGSIFWPARVLLGPYLLSAWVAWRLHRLWMPGPCWVEVAPGLWMGRRAAAGELPEAAKWVVDLTAEFAEPREVVRRRRYRCLPTLDASAPPEEGFLALVRQIAGLEAGVYVHCANGRGRSAAVVAAVLVARGIAADARQALALLRRCQPKINLSSEQSKLLERAAVRLAAEAPPGRPVRRAPSPRPAK